MNILGYFTISHILPWIFTFSWRTCFIFAMCDEIWLGDNLWFSTSKSSSAVRRILSSSKVISVYYWKSDWIRSVEVVGFSSCFPTISSARKLFILTGKVWEIPDMFHCSILSTMNIMERKKSPYLIRYRWSTYFLFSFHFRNVSMNILLRGLCIFTVSKDFIDKYL